MRALDERQSPWTAALLHSQPVDALTDKVEAQITEQVLLEAPNHHSTYSTVKSRLKTEAERREERGLIQQLESRKQGDSGRVVNVFEVLGRLVLDRQSRQVATLAAVSNQL